MNNTITFIIVGIVVAYFIIAKVIPFFKTASKVFSSFLMNKKANLTTEQYRKVLLGAIYSEQQLAYINSLETGMAKEKIQTMLRDWWGISNHSDAVETLNYLDAKGFRYYFPLVYKAYLASDQQSKKQLLIEAFGHDEEDLEKAFSQLVNLQETNDRLKKNNIISTDADIERLGNTGWDVGRLVFVARLCFDAGYINANEAWDYIDKAAVLAKSNFSNWNDYAKSYVLGRGMWGGKNSQNEGIASIADTLMTDPKSPWLEIKW